MRDIKFRGQRQSDNKWIYGDLLQPTEICDIYEISDCESIDGSRYDVIKETIGQYIGLKDKNGKEIYEGDILQQIHYHYSNDEYGHKGFKKTIFQVLWDRKMAGFNFKAIKQTDIEMPENYTEPYREVIGNIYDNPELLEKEGK